MKLSIPSLSENKNIVVSEFTLDDFRSISFMINNENDIELYEFLISKIETPCNAFDKFYTLLKSRVLFVDESITFNNGESNISINLNVWDYIIKNDYVDIKTEIVFENIKVFINYPEHLIYNNYEDLVIDCIIKISLDDKELDFCELCREDKYKLIDRLPPTLMISIKDYISTILNDELVIMQPKLNLPKIGVNVFNGSAFEIIKTLFNYYKYDDILELIFMLSKRVNDIGYINSRTPKDLDLLVKLYSEEVEKTTNDDKLNI